MGSIPCGCNSTSTFTARQIFQIFKFDFDNLCHIDFSKAFVFFYTILYIHKICIIEEYLLKYYLKATLYINNAIIDKQSSIN